mmetsp:Transcript_8541/g.11274  ORF Transcript_8541/g.11274 Transcript_8541/m.11274 type:complete len:425 (+) Transcript_8541:183-1457(+)|eukprot:CAMPEP_0198150090 /NCGR_PEP_ID=MMETSP1443-20131203/49333_1 /TAXON_ID=186043 /ORGANISM="Entomoneis sp., Strain CCMP2396" /LENGTH=424 /DNA_ID=CAMNT_0043815297 /DNA_START=210 /DNA_END=1484 /DNA_ORIENTATION=+
MRTEGKSLILVVLLIVISVASWFLYNLFFSQRSSASNDQAPNVGADSDVEKAARDSPSTQEVDQQTRSLPPVLEVEGNPSGGTSDASTDDSPVSRSVPLAGGDDSFNHDSIQLEATRSEVEMSVVADDAPTMEADLEDLEVASGELETPSKEEPVTTQEPNTAVALDPTLKPDLDAHQCDTEEEHPGVGVEPNVMEDEYHEETSLKSYNDPSSVEIPEPGSVSKYLAQFEKPSSVALMPDKSIAPRKIGRKSFGDSSTVASVSEPQQREKDDEEFTKKLSTCLVEPTDEDLQALFNSIDGNGDGQISMKEVEKAILQRKTEFKLKPAVVMQAFEKADANGDGYIGKDEFFMFMRFITYFQNLWEVFALMDTNGDRQLSKDEFKNAAAILNLENPDQVWEEMDTFHDSYIVFDEFCMWMADKKST